jgi:hypothetical protein
MVDGNFAVVEEPGPVATHTLAIVGRLHLAASARAGGLVEVPADELLQVINSFWDAQKKESQQDTRIDRAVDLLLAAHSGRRHNARR